MDKFLGLLAPLVSCLYAVQNSHVTALGDFTLEDLLVSQSQ